jgi:cell wall-associated NlpC family hydrolase
VISPPSFNRTLEFRRGRKAMSGRDVLAVERVLHLHGFRAFPPSVAYGWRARDDVALFQRHKGLPATGRYDEQTHHNLLPLFTDFDRWLYRQAHDDQPSGRSATPSAGHATAVDRLMHNLWSYYALRPWSYHEVRPFMLYTAGSAITKAYDCSWLVTQVYYAARLPDPNGFNYDGWGNTETLRDHGRRVEQASPGDLIFYGTYGDRDDPAHVTMASGNGKCISFGQSDGPFLHPEDYRPIKQIRRYIA